MAFSFAVYNKLTSEAIVVKIRKLIMKKMTEAFMKRLQISSGEGIHKVKVHFYLKKCKYIFQTLITVK